MDSDKKETLVEITRACVVSSFLTAEFNETVCWELFKSSGRQLWTQFEKHRNISELFTSLDDAQKLILVDWASKVIDLDHIKNSLEKGVFPTVPTPKKHFVSAAARAKMAQDSRLKMGIDQPQPVTRSTQPRRGGNPPPKPQPRPAKNNGGVAMRSTNGRGRASNNTNVNVSPPDTESNEMKEAFRRRIRLAMVQAKNKHK